MNVSRVLSCSLCTSSLSALMVLPGGSSVVGVLGALGAGPLLLVIANAALWWRYRVMIPRVLLTMWCMPSFSNPLPNDMRNKERKIVSVAKNVYTKCMHHRWWCRDGETAVLCIIGGLLVSIMLATLQNRTDTFGISRMLKMSIKAQYERLLGSLHADQEDMYIYVSTTVTFRRFLCGGYRASRWGGNWGVHAGRSTEVFNNLGVRARGASSTLLQQLGYERGRVTLNQRVLLPLDGLHQRPDQRVELVRKHLQVNHCTGYEHVDTEMQLLPFSVGLYHCCLSLLTFTVQRLPLFRLCVQTHCGLCEDGGYLGNKQEENVSDWKGSDLLKSAIPINLWRWQSVGYQTIT